MSKEIVIYQEWGGLGDNLAHTTIPRLCRDHGYKCYLSKHNKFNNEEIYNLLYKDSEYIDGWSDVLNSGWKSNYAQIRELGWNHLRHIQLGYGFDTAPYSYPFINYTPKFIEELKDKTLVDLSGDHCYRFFPHLFNPTNITACYTALVEAENIKNTIAVTPTNYTSFGNTEIDMPKIYINNLFDYCDALYSCNSYIGIDAGSSNLASGIKNQFDTDCEIFVLGMSEQLPPKKYDTYYYLNTNYVATDTGFLQKFSVLKL
tara:strand:+ start:2004 stop:2780 length:777 start_codon:yes stop_codon:yes gene_type:complete